MALISVAVFALSAFTVITVLFLLSTHIILDLLLWDLISVFIKELLLSIGALFGALLVFLVLLSVADILIDLLLIATSVVALVLHLRSTVAVSDGATPAAVVPDVVLLQLILLLLLLQVGDLILLELWRWDVLSLSGIVKLVQSTIIQVLKVQVRILQDVEGLITQDFSRVVFQDAVETLGELKLLTILARH